MSFNNEGIYIKADPKNEGIFLVRSQGLSNRVTTVSFAVCHLQTDPLSTILISVKKGKDGHFKRARVTFNTYLQYVLYKIPNQDSRDRKTLWNKFSVSRVVVPVR